MRSLLFYLYLSDRSDVSVWYITQNPSDIPDSVLGQLGNRVQHALRAYTPNEQKFVKAAAKSFRENPAFDTEEAIMALGVGEALVSVLDADGIPTRADILTALNRISSMLYLMMLQEKTKE